MRGSSMRVVCAAAALSLFAAVPVLAGEDSVRREGSCSGPGEWRLRVSRESATTIRVRFRIENVHPGESWQLFLSDNGTRILAATKVTNADGEVRVGKITSDRSGTDRVKGSGVNVTSGGSCDGAVTY